MEVFIAVRGGFTITLKCLNEDGIFLYKKCSKSASNYEPDAGSALLNSPACAFHPFRLADSYGSSEFRNL